MVTAASKQAELVGIFAGTSLADVRIIIPNIQAFDDQPNLNTKLLSRMGKWAVRFAPVVAIDLP